VFLFIYEEVMLELSYLICVMFTQSCRIIDPV